MKAIISVANVASDVGKTTTAVSLATEFSLRGYQTLLIDADPQADATSYFMNSAQIGWTLADILCKGLPGQSWHSFLHWDVYAPPQFTNLSFVPSCIRLATFESLSSSHLSDLKKRLGLIRNFYDLVIIDTPSSLSLITQSCLCASTHVLAPVAPNGQGKEGLKLLNEYLGTMPCTFRPTLVGVVCNLFDCHAHSSGMFYEELKAKWKEQICQTIIHPDDLIEGCIGRQQSLQLFAPTSLPVILYAQLTDEILLRLNIARPLSYTLK